jgi:hypothetical protein
MVEEEKKVMSLKIMERVLDEMVNKHKLDLRIRLWPLWKRYKRIKEKEEHEARVREMEKMAK